LTDAAPIACLSDRLLPPVNYFPHPSLVPRRLQMNATEPLPLEVLRRLGACAGDGPDAIHAPVERTRELSTDPGVEVEAIVDGGLNVSRIVLEVATGDDGRPVRVASWWATVVGLTFHADDAGRVYVDGPEGRIVLHDPASSRWAGRTMGATVWSSEEVRPAAPVPVSTTPRPVLAPSHVPAGKSKRYATYAALVEARNAARQRGTHGLVPDAVASLLGVAPMIGNSRTTSVSVVDRTEPDGLSVRRAGQRYTLRLDEATAKRMNGERGDSKQAVLRLDTSVEATGEDVGHAAMQLLREFDTETVVAVVGVMMNAYDTGNRAQRIGAADLAKIRGRQLSRASDKKRFSAMSRLLADVVIEVRPVKDDGTVARLNLFVRQGEVVVPGGHRLPLVTLNDTLYRAMQAKGHGVMLDRALMAVDMNAHEWEFRIALALSIQWSLGWVRNNYAKGKRLRRSARQLLADAWIPYDLDGERRKRGVAVVRQRIAGALTALVGMRSDLKSWKRAKEAADPADDVYEFVPSDALSARLSAHRRPALDGQPAAPVLASPKQRRKRVRGAS
jgi:hypothetical protein